MAFKDTLIQLNFLLSKVVADLNKVHKGNKTAAQRVRVGTVDLEKIAKKFRRESIAAEKASLKKNHISKNKKKRKSLWSLARSKKACL